jgi:hypothetical protein
MESLRENHENLNQNSRSTGRDLNPEPSEYEAGVLTTRPWSSAAPGYEGVWRSGRGKQPLILDLGSDEGNWSAWRSGRFISRETAPGIHWMGET